MKKRKEKKTIPSPHNDWKMCSYPWTLLSVSRLLASEIGLVMTPLIQMNASPEEQVIRSLSWLSSIISFFLLFFQNFYPKRNFTTVRILLTRRVKCDVKLWENRPLRWCFYAFKGFFYNSQNISRNLWSFSILQKSFSCCLKIPVDSFDIM